MQCQYFITFRPERINTGIDPDIGAVAAILAQLHIINMWGFSLLEDEYEFVLRTIETPHASIGFIPDTQVDLFLIDWLSSIKEFGNMPPVHKNEVQSTV